MPFEPPIRGGAVRGLGWRTGARCPTPTRASSTAAPNAAQYPEPTALNSAPVTAIATTEKTISPTWSAELLAPCSPGRDSSNVRTAWVG